MFIQSNVEVSNVTRIEMVQKLISSGEITLTVEKLFAAKDFDTFENILKNELFYEKVHRHFSKILFRNMNNILPVELELEIKRSPSKDIYSVITMLQLK